MELKKNEINNLKIIIFTRSCNQDLYIKSGQFIKLPFKRRRMKYQTAEGYFYSLLKSDADIAINIDEDAFIIDNQLLMDLLIFMIENKYVNCGFPDGGVLPIRNHNPLITNPFFNILNLRVLRNDFSFSKIKEYREFKSTYVQKTPVQLLKTEYQYNMKEPFYPFFLWISQNYKVLYLNAEQHHDGITTILKDQNGLPFLFHTWYSRFYNIDQFHTKRINDVISELGLKNFKTHHNSLENVMNKIYMPTKYFIRRVLKKLQIVNYI